jgi:TolB-like protein/AraC-like DNA-binding protein/Tfp pilus assembly protein PilF
MSNSTNFNSDFSSQAKAIILENISKEQFGVSELAEMMHMSRSNLLRKIKKDTQLSASQFIRLVRLEKSRELLKQNTFTVSEISYQVGFGSTSYFVKCFREQYGYPPSETGNEIPQEDIATIQKNGLRKYKWQILAIVSIMIVIVVVVVFFTKKSSHIPVAEIEKTIAVLPFKNESSDTLNLYFVNGLMESALNNLQKIGDLRVTSRTSVEKYRNTDKGIPEIAEELNVNYLVEGSGQRIGNQVSLNIKLIDALSDRPIWVEQYNRKVGDVFELQNEVAQKIADAIEAVITPAELKQIEKIPTENLVAYDYYLQAIEYSYTRTKEDLETAISLFEKAIENDEQFALAYANVAFSYFFLDVNQKEKQYTEEINNFADKALLHDPKSAESLMAKALYYIQVDEYKLALPHLEKALEYNPNSSAVIQMLGDIYARVLPNTNKYLEYALKGIQLDVAASDSVTQSYTYLQLSNALVQAGFAKEALTYVNKSLDFNPENYYAPFLKIFIQYALNENIERTKMQLIEEWKKDTTRLDIMQEVAKFYYFEEDYENAFYYYERFVEAREQYGLDIYQHEDAKISWVYKKKGLDEQAARFFDNYVAYCEKDESIYKSASMTVKYVLEEEYDMAIEQYKIFANQNSYMYWVVLFNEKDPILQTLKIHPEYEGILQKIKDGFWENQNQLKKTLEDKGLI